MVAICIMLVSMLQADPPMEDVAAFKRAYESRRSNDVDEAIDPGISKALDILIRNKRGGNDTAVFSWVVNPDDKEAMIDDPFWISVGTQEAGNISWIEAQMGQATRLAAFDGKGYLTLPNEFRWNYPYNADVTQLPSGMFFLEEDAIMHGTIIRYKAVWLRRKGRVLQKVGEVETDAELGQLPAEVRGNTVILKTIDEFETFSSYGASHAGGKETVWDCSGAKPKITKSWHYNPELWFADSLIKKALMHPNQNRSCKTIATAWAKYQKEFGDNFHPLDDWSLKRAKDGTIRLNFNDELLFSMRKTVNGFVLVSVKAITNKTLH